MDFIGVTLDNAIKEVSKEFWSILIKYGLPPSLAGVVLKNLEVEFAKEKEKEILIHFNEKKEEYEKKINELENELNKINANKKEKKQEVLNG